MVLELKSQRATRKIQEINSKLREGEVVQKRDRPSSSGTGADYLQQFESIFHFNGKAKDNTTAVELHSFQNPTTFICKHCDCRGPFVDVSRVGPIHAPSCPRHSLVTSKDQTSFQDENFQDRETTVEVCGQTLEDAINEERKAAANDCVIIHKLHIKGPAFLSQRITNGDEIVSVDGTPVGKQIMQLLPFFWNHLNNL